MSNEASANGRHVVSGSHRGAAWLREADEEMALVDLRRSDIIRRIDMGLVLTPEGFHRRFFDMFE